jgi:hypothetical protein
VRGVDGVAPVNVADAQELGVPLLEQPRLVPPPPRPRRMELSPKAGEMPP